LIGPSADAPGYKDRARDRPGATRWGAAPPHTLFSLFFLFT
jgi:hypothetical protein